MLLSPLAPTGPLLRVASLGGLGRGRVVGCVFREPEGVSIILHGAQASPRSGAYSTVRSMKPIFIDHLGRFPTPTRLGQARDEHYRMLR